MIAHTCVQDEFLETLVKEQTAINVFLVNGIRLSGQVSAYDCFTVMLKSGPSVQVVFKHVILTVLPANGSGPTRDPSNLPVSRAKPSHLRTQE